MIKIKERLIAFTMIAAASAVYGQDAKENEQSVTLTVEQAVDYALKNSRTLKTADIDLEIKKRESENAWNVLLPTVQVSGTLARSNDISSTLDQMNQSLKMFGAPAVSETEKMHWAIVGNLGISYTFVSATRVEATMPVDHRTRQPFGILHGGASLALAETVAGLGSMVLAKPDETPTMAGI